MGNKFRPALEIAKWKLGWRNSQVNLVANIREEGPRPAAIQSPISPGTQYPRAFDQFPVLSIALLFRSWKNRHACLKLLGKLYVFCGLHLIS